MSKKAIIYDLDNTIYPVISIGDKLFASLFRIIEESDEHLANMDLVKKDIMRKPFQVVAAQHNFSDKLTKKGIDLLKELAYDGTIEPFADFKEVYNIDSAKYLVTTGFFVLQSSKIRQLGIKSHFREIHIIDPMTSDKTKKDVFIDIMERNMYNPSDLLVIGDDPESEIEAARQLGIDTVLYDKYNHYSNYTAKYKISDFKQLHGLL